MNSGGLSGFLVNMAIAWIILGLSYSLPWWMGWAGDDWLIRAGVAAVTAVVFSLAAIAWHIVEDRK